MVSSETSVKHVVVAADGTTAVATGFLTYDYLTSTVGSGLLRILNIGGGVTIIASGLHESEAVSAGLLPNHYIAMLAGEPVWGSAVALGPLSFGDTPTDVDEAALQRLIGAIE